LYSLAWTLWEPLHCNFLAIRKNTLHESEPSVDETENALWIELVYVPPYRQHQNLLHQAYCSQQSYQSQSVKLIYQEEVNRCFQCPQHWLNLSEYSDNTIINSTSIYHK
jgi:hypothetical protein